MSEEAPSAPESASTSTATTEVFHSSARAYRWDLESTARWICLQHLCDLVNVGVELTHDAQRAPQRASPKFFGGVVSDDPALIRAYLDAKRGISPPRPPRRRTPPTSSPLR